jgi:hypothetical protein
MLGILPFRTNRTDDLERSGQSFPSRASFKKKKPKMLRNVCLNYNILACSEDTRNPQGWRQETLKKAHFGLPPSDNAICFLKVISTFTMRV